MVINEFKSCKLVLGLIGGLQDRNSRESAINLLNLLCVLCGAAGFKANVERKYPIEIGAQSSKTTMETAIGWGRGKGAKRAERDIAGDGDVATKPQNQFDDGVEVEVDFKTGVG